MRAAEREENFNCASAYSSCFVLQAMASKVPLCYIQLCMGCEMMYSFVLSVVLGQHWRALDFSICECQSATSLMFGFIFSFSSWVNFRIFRGAMDLECPEGRSSADATLCLTIEINLPWHCHTTIKCFCLWYVSEEYSFLLIKIMSRLLQHAEHVSVSHSWGYWTAVLLNGAWRCRTVVEKGLISWVC